MTISSYFIFFIIPLLRIFDKILILTILHFFSFEMEIRVVSTQTCSTNAGVEAYTEYPIDVIRCKNFTSVPDINQEQEDSRILSIDFVVVVQFIWQKLVFSYQVIHDMAENNINL